VLTLKLSLLILAGLLNVLTGMVVLFKDATKAKHVYFLLLSISLSGWVFGIAGFLYTDTADLALIWAKIYYFFPLLISASLVLFVRTFVVERARFKIPEMVAIGGFAGIAIQLIFHDQFVTKSIVYHDWGKEVVLDPASYIIYSIYLVGCFIYALAYILFMAGQLKGYLRAQAQVFFVGFTLTSGLGVFFNLFLPGIGNYRLIWLGPLFTSFFVVSIAYSIVKQRMFDLRLVVARSLAYSLLLASLAAIYVSGILTLSRLLASEEASLEVVGPFISALFVIATAPFIKIFFDKLTDRLFYRDRYEPQAFLDQLNRTIVGNIELGLLVRHTADVIKLNMKAECYMAVGKTATAPIRITGTSKTNFTDKDLHFISDELKTIPDKIVVTDALGEQYGELKTLLDKHDVAVTISLKAQHGVEQNAIAYLMLEHKKSGNSYSKQDLRIMGIIADELLIAIQNALHFEEIQTFNITLQNRINEATKKLKRSNQKLKDMDNTKDEFISMASHQLRTPLTSVKGYLSMVLEGDVGNVTPAQRQLLNQAYTSSQRMVYLIADLLNISRLKTGKFIINASPTNVIDMVSSEIAQLKEVAKSHDLTLDFKHPEEVPLLSIDETKTRQVVMNFVDNAIYYTPAGGKIKVEIQVDRSHMYFTVKDNGLGVPKADQSRLFTKFYRAHNAQEVRPDGTGLGLFMAKKVISEQGGTILFESAEGKGSTFGFKFDIPKTPLNDLN
jgi:signal transduction histidine kinase